MNEVLQAFSPAAQELKLGLYEHYKGYRYQVLYVARHTETLEELVVYQSMYGNYEMWVRPLSMFVETVEIDGRDVPRFKLIETH